MVLLLTIALVAYYCEYGREGIGSNDGFDGLALSDAQIYDYLQSKVSFVQLAGCRWLVV